MTKYEKQHFIQARCHLLRRSQLRWYEYQQFEVYRFEPVLDAVRLTCAMDESNGESNRVIRSETSLQDVPYVMVEISREVAVDRLEREENQVLEGNTVASNDLPSWSSLSYGTRTWDKAVSADDMLS